MVLHRELACHLVQWFKGCSKSRIQLVKGGAEERCVTTIHSYCYVCVCMRRYVCVATMYDNQFSVSPEGRSKGVSLLLSQQAILYFCPQRSMDPSSKAISKADLPENVLVLTVIL